MTLTIVGMRSRIRQPRFLLRRLRDLGTRIVRRNDQGSRQVQGGDLVDHFDELVCNVGLLHLYEVPVGIFEAFSLPQLKEKPPESGLSILGRDCVRR